MDQKLQGQAEIDILASTGRMARVKPVFLCCLQPERWLNDEVINGYVQLVQTAAQSGIVVLNSFFLIKLAHQGYNSVKREWNKVKGPITSPFQFWSNTACRNMVKA